MNAEDVHKPLKFSPAFWFRTFWGVLKKGGPSAALRLVRVAIEDRIAARGNLFALRLVRAWQLLLIAVGAALALSAPAAHTAGGTIDIGSLARYAVQVGIGVAVALRALAHLLATYSMSLLVHRFRVSLRPSIVRAITLGVIGAVCWKLPWPVSAWTAVALAAVAWVCWPILVHAVIAAQAPTRLSRHMAPVDHLLAMNARQLSAPARQHVAAHEAGHAVFFGLGTRVPEDLFAFMDDEIPAAEEVSAVGAHPPAGAVGAYASLAEKSLLLDARQHTLFAFLGMVCGGAAAEIITLGAASAGVIGDVAQFESRARQYLSLFPDPRWPYFVQPANEEETKTNAASLAAFRSHMTACAVQFLQENIATHTQVQAALLDRGELDVEDLRVLLSNVRPAAGFAKFDWPSDIPAMDYLAAGR